ncbi:RNA polymerase II transcription factor SIII (Elongin) subunit A domain-containing protein [Ditylenchus destructor]|nr:RNA polymerase II transcription factor SIII (Elongin) subunit A domain-containing protein [Ditylenchus destructor]
MAQKRCLLWRNGRLLQNPKESQMAQRSRVRHHPKEKVKIRNQTSNDKMMESSLDPFAAQLAAADKLSSSKPKKAKFSASIVDEIERSLAMEGGSTSRASSATRSYSPLESEIDAKDGTFKRKGMMKMYSGKRVLKTIKGPVPSLYDTCMKVCMNNIDAIEETGDIPFDILRPVLEKCSYTQLARIESKNKYFEEDSDYLWERHCQKVFPNADAGDDEDETWKERFMRLTHERDQKLKNLSQRITSNARDLAQPQRQTMLSDPIAPRYARQRQIRNGIMVSSASVPSAAELSKSRRQIFETGNRSDLSALPKALRNTTSTVGGSSSSRNNNAKPQAKRGALMVKAMKMMKGRR